MAQVNHDGIGIQLLKRHRQLEQDLARDISGLLAGFKMDTGLSVKAIDVVLHEMAQTEAVAPRYVLGYVRAPLAVS